MAAIIKLSYMRCLCVKNENILNFGLSPLCMVIKVLVTSVIKLGCMCSLCCKRLSKNVLAINLNNLFALFLSFQNYFFLVID